MHCNISTTCYPEIFLFSMNGSLRIWTYNWIVFFKTQLMYWRRVHDAVLERNTPTLFVAYMDRSTLWLRIPHFCICTLYKLPLSHTLWLVTDVSRERREHASYQECYGLFKSLSSIHEASWIKLDTHLMLRVLFSHKLKTGFSCLTSVAGFGSEKTVLEKSVSRTIYSRL